MSEFRIRGVTVFIENNEPEPSIGMLPEETIWQGDVWPTYDEAKSAVNSHAQPQIDGAFTATTFSLEEGHEYRRRIRSYTGVPTSFLEMDWQPRLTNLSEVVESKFRYLWLGGIARLQAHKAHRS